MADTMVSSFNGVLPRVFDKDMTKLTYQEMAAGIYQVDTAGWAETWEVLSGRIFRGVYCYC